MSDTDKPVALLTLPDWGDLVEAIRPYCQIVMLPVHESERRAWIESNGFRVQILIKGPGLTLDRTLVEALPNLGLIAIFGTGYDGIDVEYLSRRGIAVTHGRGTSAEDVADVAIGLMLSTVRHLARGDRLIRAGGWRARTPVPLAVSAWRLRHGIVGLGHIGTAIAHRLEGFGTAIAWWGPREQPLAPWPRLNSLLDLAAQSDVLYISARSGHSTRGLVNSAVLHALGPKGYLINVSRGFLVDESALLTALRTGGIAGAGIDTFETEPTHPELFQGIETIALSPHIGGWASHSIREAATQAAENVRRYVQGEPVLTPVRERSA